MTSEVFTVFREPKQVGNYLGVRETSRDDVAGSVTVECEETGRTDLYGRTIYLDTDDIEFVFNENLNRLESPSSSYLDSAEYFWSRHYPDWE